MRNNIIRFFITVILCVIGLSAKIAQAETSQVIKPGQSVAALVKMHQQSYDSTGAQSLTWEAIYALNKSIMIPVCTRFDAMKGISKDVWTARGERGEAVWQGCEQNRQSVWLIAGTTVKIPVAPSTMATTVVQEDLRSKQLLPRVTNEVVIADADKVDPVMWQKYPDDRRPFAVAETKISASSTVLDILHKINLFVFLPLAVIFVIAVSGVIYEHSADKILEKHAEACEKEEVLARRVKMIEDAHARNCEMIAQREDVSSSENVSAAFVEQLIGAAMGLQGAESIVVTSKEEARMVEKLLNVRVTFDPRYFGHLAAIEVLEMDPELKQKLADLTIAELKEFLDLFQPSPVIYQEPAPEFHESPQVS